jgi:hypothetical protein
MGSQIECCSLGQGIQEGSPGVREEDQAREGEIDMPAAWLRDELEQYFDSSEFKHSHWRQDTSRFLSRKKRIPPWTKSDQKIQSLLLCVFPKLNQNARQRKAAGRWACSAPH